MAFLGHRDDRHDMGKQRAGGVEFLAVDDGVIALETHLGFKGGDVLALAFGEGVAIAQALQRPAEEQFLLFLGAIKLNGADDGEVVLGDLGDGRIGGGNDLDHLGQRGIGHVRAAIGLGNINAPQAALGIFIEFGKRQKAFTVTKRGPLAKLRGQACRDLDSLGVAADDMGGRRRARTRRNGIGRIDARMDGIVDLGFGKRAHDILVYDGGALKERNRGSDCRLGPSFGRSLCWIDPD